MKRVQHVGNREEDERFSTSGHQQDILAVNVSLTCDSMDDPDDDPRMITPPMIPVMTLRTRR
jgi:hypothetical protein